MMILIAYLLAAGLILIDQLSKIIIMNLIPLGESRTIIPGLINFTSVYNTGAAFSFLAEHREILTLISLLGAIFLAILLKDVDFKKRPLYSVSLVLIFSGAVGNMIDRFFRPEGVFDFIEPTFIRFATFNFADMCLTIGVFLLVPYFFFFEKKYLARKQAGAKRD